MLEWLSAALHVQELGPLAVLDILILYFVIYRLILLIRGRRAVNMLWGLIAVVIAHFTSGPEILNLRGLHTALGYMLLYIPFAIIVLFQNPIRQALARVVRNPIAAMLPRRGQDKTVEEVALAAASLASRKIGSLIVFERELGLRAFSDTGITLDALVTYDLLVNIFVPGSALHDGAVIIADGRIRAASCFLPLTTTAGLSRHYGTRHRAAIGITEESDAVAVVVSEERGIVSLAEDGNITENLDAAGLAARLTAALSPGGNGREEQPVVKPAVADSSHA